MAGIHTDVLVKRRSPGCYARKDTKTPVKTALVVLICISLVSLVVIVPFCIVGLASATAAASWLNCALLYTILHRRGHYRLNGKLLFRLGRQLIAAAIMAAALLAARDPLVPWFAGRSEGRRVGEECVSTGRFRWSPVHSKKKTKVNREIENHN